MLGADHFKHWVLPHDPRFIVLWVKLPQPEQIIFLDWCVKNGIKLFAHTVTSNYLIPTAVNNAKANILMAKEPNLGPAVEIDYEYHRLALLDQNRMHSPRMWYMIEAEGSDEHLILMKLKWQ